MKKYAILLLSAVMAGLCLTSCDEDSGNDYSYGNTGYSQSGGEFYCMGKNDTCKNKTSDPFDFYCYSCDPDNNNIEGDQR
ncbi:MAG: hypothetical protein NC340_04260 [Ruminococcus flavefaciens]|nr:hypothetical protein [Ruminococcus flavefaciens]MCM1229266.1 hypothetical protein [Ruminococcus flavefaciens]